MYLHWECGDKISAFAWSFISTATWAEKNTSGSQTSLFCTESRSQGSVYQQEPPLCRTLQEPRRKNLHESSDTKPGSAGACAQYFPSCFYSVVPAEVQPSPGPLVPPLRMYSWKQDPADLSCREQRLGATRLSRGALHSPVWTTGVFLEGACQNTARQERYRVGVILHSRSNCFKILNTAQPEFTTSFCHKCSIYSALSFSSLHGCHFQFWAELHFTFMIYNLGHGILTRFFSPLFSFFFFSYLYVNVFCISDLHRHVFNSTPLSPKKTSEDSSLQSAPHSPF